MATLRPRLTPTASRSFSSDAGMRSAGLVVGTAVLAYLVLEAALPNYFEAPSFGVSLALPLAAGCAALGWRTGLPVRTIAPYLIAASFFCAWMVISAVAAWDQTSVYDAMTFSVWLLFIVPGLAAFIRDDRMRRAMINAFVAALAVYGFVVLSRYFRGESVLDEVSSDRVIGRILGRNRNLVSMGIMVSLPFVVERVVPRAGRVLRWTLLVLGGAAVVYGGGRAGILGLATLALAYALLRRSGGRKLHALAGLAIAGALIVIITQSIGGPIATSTDRLFDYFGGKTEHSDDVRELMVRKAWRLGMDHPAFGVGYGNFETTYHPVIEEAKNLRVYEDAKFYSPHSTYAQALAEMGIPGAISYLALIGSVAAIAVARSRSRETRAAAVGFLALATMMGFDAVLGGGMIYLVFALVLGGAAAFDDASAASASTPEA